jgi:hypothetical protein
MRVGGCQLHSLRFLQNPSSCPATQEAPKITASSSLGANHGWRYRVPGSNLHCRIPTFWRYLGGIYMYTKFTVVPYIVSTTFGHRPVLARGDKSRQAGRASRKSFELIEPLAAEAMLLHGLTQHNTPCGAHDNCLHLCMSACVVCCRCTLSLVTRARLGRRRNPAPTFMRWMHARLVTMAG